MASRSSFRPRFGSHGSALSLCIFHHVYKTTSEALKLMCEVVLTVWERARIPTQSVDTCIVNLRRIWNRVKKEMFVEELQSLFDVASCDAPKKMKNEEDNNFLQMQRDDVSSSSMAGVDSNTS